MFGQGKKEGFLDSDFLVDISEIKRNIETAEVIALYFPLLRKTLLIDTRYNTVDGPLAKVVPMASSVEERFKSLRKLRPNFTVPESITVMAWPKYVETMRRLGILDKIVERLERSGYTESIAACHKGFNDLLKLERQEVVRAIKGNNYKSLWERKR
jgi:hypothetical protein